MCPKKCPKTSRKKCRSRWKPSYKRLSCQKHRQKRCRNYRRAARALRKIRIKDTPPPKPEPGYWNDRLQEHRATQRAAKSERYANLPIM